MISVPDPHQAMKAQLLRDTQRLQESVTNRQQSAQRDADASASARASEKA
jgi:hypothetical protein